MGALYKQRGPLTTNPLSGYDELGPLFQLGPPFENKVGPLCFSEFSFYRCEAAILLPEALVCYLLQNPTFSDFDVLISIDGYEYCDCDGWRSSSPFQGPFLQNI